MIRHEHHPGGSGGPTLQDERLRLLPHHQRMHLRRGRGQGSQPRGGHGDGELEAEGAEGVRGQDGSRDGEEVDAKRQRHSDQDRVKICSSLRLNFKTNLSSSFSLHTFFKDYAKK